MRVKRRRAEVRRPPLADQQANQHSHWPLCSVALIRPNSDSDGREGSWRRSGMRRLASVQSSPKLHTRGKLFHLAFHRAPCGFTALRGLTIVLSGSVSHSQGNGGEKEKKKRKKERGAQGVGWSAALPSAQGFMGTPSWVLRNERGSTAALQHFLKWARLNETIRFGCPSAEQTVGMRKENKDRRH